MLMSIPSIFKSKRHASSSSMWSNRMETSSGRTRGSSGMISGGSHSAMASLMVSLTNMHVFLSNFQKPFLMELCIVVLERFGASHGMVVKCIHVLSTCATQAFFGPEG